MRVAIVFVFIAFSIIALCGAEDSSDASISLLEREAREAASPVRQKKSKSSKKIKKKKNSKKKSKNGRKIKKRNNNKAKRKSNKKGKSLRKNKSGKNKKQRKQKLKRKNEKKRRLKNGTNNRKSKTKNGNRKQKKAKRVIKQVEKCTCKDPSDQDQAGDQDKPTRNAKRQAKQLLLWFNLMNTKGEKSVSFASYSQTLDDMTGKGINCGPAAKNASEFLSKCPTTAKSACNTTEFKKNVTMINDTCVPVNCSISKACKDMIKFTHKGLKDVKKYNCLNSTVTGSFSNCMKVVKELGTNIISDCVADIKESNGTCSGETVSIIPLTDMAPSITTNSPIRRSRKRFY